MRRAAPGSRGLLQAGSVPFRVSLLSSLFKCGALPSHINFLIRTGKVWGLQRLKHQCTNGHILPKYCLNPLTWTAEPFKMVPTPDRGASWMLLSFSNIPIFSRMNIQSKLCLDLLLFLLILPPPFFVSPPELLLSNFCLQWHIFLILCYLWLPPGTLTSEGLPFFIHN